MIHSSNVLLLFPNKYTLVITQLATICLSVSSNVHFLINTVWQKRCWQIEFREGIHDHAKARNSVEPKYEANHNHLSLRLQNTQSQIWQPTRQN